MTRYIASTLFKDQDGTVIPYLIRYNNGNDPEQSFETVKKFIENMDDVTYVAGKPMPCYADPRYPDIYKVIDKDYTFLFREKGKGHGHH